LGSERGIFFEAASTDVLGSISEYFDATKNRCSGSRLKTTPPASDSDSGDSLFLTQSVTPVLRTVKRHHPSESPALPFCVESDSECEGGGKHDDGAHKQDGPGTVPRRESDSDLTDDDLFGGPRKMLALPAQRSGRNFSKPRKRRHAPPCPHRTKFPFLRTTTSGVLTVPKNQILVNSEIGGFFKCVKKINMGQEEGRIELSSSLCDSSLEEEESVGEEDDDNYDDIRVVDAEAFISNSHKRNRHTWLPVSRSKAGESPRTPKTKKEKVKKNTPRNDKKKPGKSKKSPVSKAAEVITEAEENTETLSDTQVSSPSFRTSQSKSKKKEKENSTPTSLSAFSVRSLLMDQEQNSEQQLEVLATSSQETQDLLCSHTQGCENLALGGSDDETVIEETQRPDSDQALEDTEETPRLEIRRQNLRERNELHERDSVTSEDVLREVQENSGPDREDDSTGPDSSMPHPKEKMPTSKCQFPTQLVDDDLSGLAVNADSSPGKKLIIGGQAEMTIGTVESPVFNFGGLSLLKRRKRKTTKKSELLHGSHTETGQHDGSLLFDEVSVQTMKGKSGNEEVLQQDASKNLVQSEMAALLFDEPSGLDRGTSSSQSRGHKRDRQETRTLEPDDIAESAETCGSFPDLQVDDLVTPRKKKRRKRDQVAEDHEAIDVCQVESSVSVDAPKASEDSEQFSELVPEGKVMTKKKVQLVQQGVDIEAAQMDNSEQIEAAEITPHSEQEATESVPEIKGRRRAQTGEDEVGTAKQIEDVEMIQHSELQSIELVPEKKEKKKKKKKRKKEQVGEDHVSLEACQLETAAHFEAVEVIQSSEQQAAELLPEKKQRKKKKKGSGVIEESVDIESSQLENSERIETVEIIQHSEQDATESIPAKKVKKKRKKGKVGEDDVTIDNSQVETAEDVEMIQHSELQSMELVPEKKVKKKRKREQVGEDETVQASHLETTAQVEMLKEIQHSEQQAAELVLKKKMKKKKHKQPRVFGESETLETSQMEKMENAKHVEATEVVLCPEDLDAELVPEEKLKEKKKKKTGVVKEHASVEASQNETTEQTAAPGMIQDSEPQATESVSKTKLKKKKKKHEVTEENVETSQMETTEQADTLEMILDSGLQAIELVPKNKKKKKKKKKKQHGEILENGETSQIETREQAEALERIVDFEQQATDLVPETKLKKKKKKRKQLEVAEEHAAAETSQIETTELAVALEMIQDSELQAAELLPEKKVKKKKKMKLGVIDENATVKTSQINKATKQAGAVKTILDFEQQAIELVPEKKLKKKKKKKSGLLEDDVAVETAEQGEAVNMIKHYEQHATALVPEKKPKKKKKKKSNCVDAEDVDMEQAEFLEMDL
ncbi:hypothetical protein NFI96_032111, partial [Prochilodus magdalenae]